MTLSYVTSVAEDDHFVADKGVKGLHAFGVKIRINPAVMEHVEIPHCVGTLKLAF